MSNASTIPLYTRATHALQVRESRSHNVASGAALAVVAVIACAFIILLLWYLKRQSRRERRWANRIDLLGSGNFDTRDVFTEGGESISEGQKPLPPVPYTPSTIAFGHSDHERMPSISSRTSKFNSDFAISIRPPPPVMPTYSRWSISTIGSPSTTYRTLSSPTIGTSETIIKPATSASSLPAKSSSSGADKSHPPGPLPMQNRFAVVNLSDAESAHFGGTQTLRPDMDLPPSYTSNRVRGRDVPFPCKQSQKHRPPSIIIAPNEQDEQNEQDTHAPILPPSVARVRRSLLEVPDSPSYTVMIPVASPAPSTPVRAQNIRSPLTITASYPVSSVVVGDISRIRRPDGSKGKSRMVTMSVVVEDCGSSDGDPDEQRATPRPIFETSESHGADNSLEGILDQYADLPPYESPNQRRSGSSSSSTGLVENSLGDTTDIKV
ncbi:hypothetical protein BU17DRAFT_68489 [Hysterangium stoloniferum]|nr:hypothetical protein BU17DRAFT_68489 [Hysterangium stoloniferum]